MSALFLSLTVLCYFTANIFQKKFSSTLEGRMHPTFLFQACWMGLAALVFLLIGLFSGGLSVSPPTLLALLSGVLMLAAGASLMKALASGPMALSLLIYSMYIAVAPVLSMLFLDEIPSLWQFAGLSLTILVIALANLGGGKKDGKKEKEKNSTWWLFGLSGAVLTGAANFVMKIHQTAMPGEEKLEYSVISYATAALLATLAYVILKKKEQALPKYTASVKHFFPCVLAMAICQGAANILNLTNVSLIPAIILFPVTQMATLLISTAYAMLLYKEKLTKVTASCFILGIAAIVLLNL